MNRLRGRSLHGLVLLVTAAGLTACGSTVGDGGTEGTGAASCAAVIRYQGASYWGSGELERDPALTGRRVRGVLPGCDDTGGQEPVERDQRVRVTELVGVPLETAFWWNGTIFVREGRELPPSARTWFRAPRCTTAAEFRLVADWLGVSGPKKLRFDGDLRPPFRLRLHVTQGPSRYVGSTITVHADAATDPTLGPEDVKRSLWRGGQVVAVVACEAGSFTARGLRVPSSPTS